MKPQVVCLQNIHNPIFMVAHFDKFTPDVRARLRESPFDICCACIVKRAGHNRFSQLSIIADIEREIRAEESISAK